MEVDMESNREQNKKNLGLGMKSRLKDYVTTIQENVVGFNSHNNSNVGSH